MHYSLPSEFLQNEKWKYSLRGNMYGSESNMCEDKRWVKNTCIVMSISSRPVTKQQQVSCTAAFWFHWPHCHSPTVIKYLWYSLMTPHTGVFNYSGWWDLSACFRWAELASELHEVIKHNALMRVIKGQFLRKTRGWLHTDIFKLPKVFINATFNLWGLCEANKV